MYNKQTRGQILCLADPRVDNTDDRKPNNSHNSAIAISVNSVYASIKACVIGWINGSAYAAHVKTAKSSRFYSFKSILAGAKNNLLGMVGFVREGKRSDATFKHRIDSEKELLEKVKARKAARLAEQQKQ